MSPPWSQVQRVQKRAFSRVLVGIPLILYGKRSRCYSCCCPSNLLRLLQEPEPLCDCARLAESHKGCWLSIASVVTFNVPKQVKWIHIGSSFLTGQINCLKFNRICVRVWRVSIIPLIYSRWKRTYLSKYTRTGLCCWIVYLVNWCSSSSPLKAGQQ